MQAPLLEQFSLEKGATGMRRYCQWLFLCLYVPLMNTFTPGKPVASSLDVTIPVTVVCPKAANCDTNKIAKSNALFPKYKIKKQSM
jgi:hypothetical protein